MIKPSTVIRRMIKDHWKSAAVLVGMVTSFVVASVLAEGYFGMDADTVYWSLVLTWFIVVGAKWTYDAKKSQIEFEQKQMLKDIERSHL